MMDIFIIMAFVVMVYLLIEEFGMISHGSVALIIMAMATSSIIYPIVTSYMEGINLFHVNWISLIANGAKNFMSAIFCLVFLIVIVNYVVYVAEKLLERIKRIKEEK